MGHIRLKRLPATRKWREVVGLLLADAPVERVAFASSDAAEAGLQGARRDPVLAYSLWLLTQLPLAARAPDFPGGVDARIEHPSRGFAPRNSWSVQRCYRPGDSWDERPNGSR